MIRKKGQRHEDEHGRGLSCHMGPFSTSRTEGGCWEAVGDHQHKRGTMGE